MVVHSSLLSRAVEEILEYSKNAKTVGVGTGRTVGSILEMLPNAFFKDKLFIATSMETLYKLLQKGARVLDMQSLSKIDFYFDSADWYDDECNLIKGYGGALLSEKVVAGLSSNSLFVLSREKHSSNLLEKPIPLEIEPISFRLVEQSLAEMGFRIIVRQTDQGKRGPLISDHGNILADALLEKAVGGSLSLKMDTLETMLQSIPGVIAVGIFTRKLTNSILTEMPNGSVVVKYCHA